MQLFLPVFPKEIKVISKYASVFEHDKIVNYFAGGVPVHCHPVDDQPYFRFVVSNLISRHLCTKTEVAQCFGVTSDSVSKWHKLFVKEGPDAFFGPDARHGKAHVITGEKRERIQSKLDKGQSNNSIAKEEGIGESAIRYALGVGNLKKKAPAAVAPPVPAAAGPTTANERNEADQSAPMGMATTRHEDRLFAALGAGGNAAAIFGAHDAVQHGGVLLLLPALVSQGLLKAGEVYQIPQTHYYGLRSLLLTLAFMGLLRIKNPEQLKQCKPGELGKVLGLDRVPEVRCLREKIKLLTGQGKSRELGLKLADLWHGQMPDGDLFLSIDGHVRVYYGDLANLPAKYVSRQKLCLNATTEYWVNDVAGMPVMMVMGELTDKLQAAIETQVVPQLQKTSFLPQAQKEAAANPFPTVADPQKPACTLVFDREAYDVPFFKRLWENHKIAILTYRKNVRDQWDVQSFKTVAVTVLSQTVSMDICEQEVTLGGVTFREIRRLMGNGHQTSIITNNRTIGRELAAGRMFGRWSQENFFRYMISDYDFDKMIEFGTEAADKAKEVVNPEYNKWSHKIKKQKEKINRLKAQFQNLVEQMIDADLDAIPKLEQRQAALIEKLEEMTKAQLNLEAGRATVKPRVKLEEMPDATRYNRLKTESKMFINTIKMISYRAETSIANILAEYLKDDKENRMLVKQIINNNVDIYPDYKNQTLTITLHSLSAQRFNSAARKLADLLTDTETVFPDTNLRMIFKTTAC